MISNNAQISPNPSEIVLAAIEFGNRGSNRDKLPQYNALDDVLPPRTIDIYGIEALATTAQDLGLLKHEGSAQLAHELLLPIYESRDVLEGIVDGRLKAGNIQDPSAMYIHDLFDNQDMKQYHPLDVLEVAMDKGFRIHVAYACPGHAGLVQNPQGVVTAKANGVYLLDQMSRLRVKNRESRPLPPDLVEKIAGYRFQEMGPCPYCKVHGSPDN